MGEIRYIIIAKQCEVAGKLLILDGCLKQIFGAPISYRRFSLQPNTVLLYYHISNAMQYSNAALENTSLVMYDSKSFSYRMPLFLMAL